MSQRHKIIHYVPHSLHINSFSNQRDLLRRGPSKVIKIKVAETFRSYPYPFSQSRKLIKLLKRVKGLKRLSLDHMRLEITGRTSPLILLMKRIRRIQELTLSDLWMELMPFKTKLHLWMRYIENLKKFTFKLKIFRNRISERNSFVMQMNSFLKTLKKRQHRLKTLKLQLPQKTYFVNTVLLQSRKYPQSLQHLQLLFNEKHYEGRDDKLSIDLSIFKKLETFALETTDDYFVTSHLMDTLPSFPHLKNLAVILPHPFVIPEASVSNGPHCYNLDSQAFSNLKSLSLRTPIEYTKVSLFKRLNLSNLQSLQLSFYLMNPQKYKAVLFNFSKMKHLRTLKLSIFYWKQLKELTKVLFENLVGLELLACLRIFLESSINIPGDRPQEEISAEVLPILPKILQKPIRIQDFSFECKELIISKEIVGLMEIFRASGKEFKRLKLDAVPLKLDEEKIERLTGFIGSLENIQTLKLACFDLDSNEILTEMASVLVKLKEIRHVELGRIGGEKIGDAILSENIARIIEKRGLRTFKSQVTDDMIKRVDSLSFPTSLLLCFEKITKKNPYLKFISEELLMLLRYEN